VHGAGVLRDESVERVRQREDDVEVRHGQQVFLLPVEPRVGVGALAARTMPGEATFLVQVSLDLRGVVADRRAKPNVWESICTKSAKVTNGYLQSISQFLLREPIWALLIVCTGSHARDPRVKCEYLPSKGRIYRRAVTKLTVISAKWDQRSDRASRPLAMTA